MRVYLLFGIVLIIVAILVCWMIIPGPFERRFHQIQTGMLEKDVQNIMGSDGDSTGKKWRITGDKRQRVWLIHEKTNKIEMVIVFDSDSRVADKQIYKSTTLLNFLGDWN